MCTETSCFCVCFFVGTFVDVLLDTAAVVDQVVALLDGVVDQSAVFVHFLIMMAVTMMRMMVVLMIMTTVMDTGQGYGSTMIHQSSSTS